MSKKTIQTCLTAIGVINSDFSTCITVQEEFRVVKKVYFAKILISHPDKGGDAAIFREVQTSFEVLREMFDKGKIDSFAKSASKSTAQEYKDVYEEFGSKPMPSWDYFYSAAEEEVPTYCVELARSNRSGCKAKGHAKHCTDPIIPKGEIRVGSMNKESGAYGYWVHLGCWRVPSKVWLGLPSPKLCHDTAEFEAALLKMNQVLLCGFSELSANERAAVVAYVMNEDNWARMTNRKQPTSSASSSGAPHAPSASASGMSGGRISVYSGQSNALAIPAREVFTISKDVPRNAMAGKTVVLTGTFPEIGGGAGLNLGKDRLKQLIESYGGKVTSAISGRTDILMVGKDPGFSKISKARTTGKVQLMSIRDFKSGVEGGCIEDVRMSQPITKFSTGYGGNSLALTASAAEFAIASGRMEPPHAAPKRSAPVQYVDDTGEVITCDSCSTVCSKRSWFIKQTEEDFCDLCYANCDKEGALQINGVAVEEKKKKPRKPAAKRAKRI